MKSTSSIAAIPGGSKPIYPAIFQAHYQGVGHGRTTTETVTTHKPSSLGRMAEEPTLKRIKFDRTAMSCDRCRSRKTKVYMPLAVVEKLTLRS